MFQWIIIGVVVYYFYNKHKNEKAQLKGGSRPIDRKNDHDDEYIDYEEVD